MGEEVTKKTPRGFVKSFVVEHADFSAKKRGEHLKELYRKILEAGFDVKFGAVSSAYYNERRRRRDSQPLAEGVAEKDSEELSRKYRVVTKLGGKILNIPPLSKVKTASPDHEQVVDLLRRALAAAEKMVAEYQDLKCAERAYRQIERIVQSNRLAKAVETTTRRAQHE